jgi:dipeptidyl aminopeptidase/acylaminoacyl peptidase
MKTAATAPASRFQRKYDRAAAGAEAPEPVTDPLVDSNHAEAISGISGLALPGDGRRIFFLVGRDANFGSPRPVGFLPLCHELGRFRPAADRAGNTTAAAAAADGILGGDTAGSWVQLDSSGKVTILDTQRNAAFAWTSQPASFDRTVTHSKRLSPRLPCRLRWMDAYFHSLRAPGAGWPLEERSRRRRSSSSPAQTRKSRYRRRLPLAACLRSNS